MQRERPALVLQPHARPLARQHLQFGPQPIERRRGGCVRRSGSAFDMAAVGMAAFDPVQPGCGAVPRVKQPVEIGDRPAADQRQRTVALAGQPIEEARQARRHLDLVRMRRDLEQGPVDIDQQSRLPVEARRYGHPGHTSPIRRLCGAQMTAQPRSSCGAMRKSEACQRFLQRGIDSGRPLPKLCSAVWIIC